MKKLFISILKPVVRALYRLIKTIKKTYFKMFVSHHEASRSVNNSDTAYSSHYSSRKTRLTIWRDWRFVLATCTGVIIIAVILSIALPKHDAVADTAALALFPAVDIKESVSTIAPDPSNMDSDVLSESSFVSSQPISSDNSASPEPSATDIVAGNLSVETEPVSTTKPDDTEPIATTAPDIPDLVPGCSDPRIIDIQERLMELGYMGEDEPTDYYGYGTEYAIQLFQRKHNLQVDGLLGTQTQSALFSKDAMPYTVKLGDRGTDVEGIQERLQELKYLKAGSTGYFGTDTETAVKSFQKRNGLSTDGNVGDNTLEILYSEDAKPAKTSTSGGSSGGGSGGSSSGGSGDSSSGGGSDVSDPPPGDPDGASADALIEFAKTQLGKKYVRGGKGPKVFDCSGFVYYCLNQVGYKIKYMTSAGWAKSNLPKVSKMADLQKGDIICFKGHVGIYMGDSKMIDASSSQGKIRICSNIFNSSYWTRNFICGRRVF